MGKIGLVLSSSNPIFQFLHSFMNYSVFKLEFGQLPLIMGYQYILVVVCIFSGWVEAFPCSKADALTETKSC